MSKNPFFAISFLSNIFVLKIVAMGKDITNIGSEQLSKSKTPKNAVSVMVTCLIEHKLIPYFVHNFP